MIREDQKHSIIALLRRGLSERAVARLIGVDRGTIRRCKNRTAPAYPRCRTCGARLVRLPCLACRIRERLEARG